MILGRPVTASRQYCISLSSYHRFQVIRSKRHGFSTVSSCKGTSGNVSINNSCGYRLISRHLSQARYLHHSTDNLSKKKNFKSPSYQNINISKVFSEPAASMEIAGYTVFPWAISGLESCIVVKKAGAFSIAFDMGYAHKEASNCKDVFISHGHIDHVSSIIQHACKRNLFSMRPATYYVPPQLVPHLNAICESFMKMHEETDRFPKLNLHPISPGETVKLGGGYKVTAFPTKHRISSQGYIVSHERRELKPECKGLSNQEIQGLLKDGEKIHEIKETQEVVYTGDTMFDVFKDPPLTEILNTKLLITEATYIDDDVDSHGKTSRERARDRGHCHLQEFVDNRELFKNVDNLLLVHFSDKYPVRYIERRVEEIVPRSLKDKLHLATQMKRMQEEFWS